MIKNALLCLPLLASLCGTAHADLVLRGDVDRDGAISSEDANLVLSASLALASLDRQQVALADADLDGAVTEEDARVILHHTAGMIRDLGLVYVKASPETETVEEIRPKVASVGVPRIPDTQSSEGSRRPLTSRIADFLSGRPARSSSLQATVIDNETVFLWPSSGSRYARVRFTQDGKSVTVYGKVETFEGREGFRLKKYISRPLRDGRLGNDYTRFEKFAPNQAVKVEISTSPSRDEEYAFLSETEIVPVVHVFDPGVYGAPKPEVSLQEQLPSTARVGETIEVAGRVLTSEGLRSGGYVVPPTGFPEPVTLDASGSLENGVFGPRIARGRNFRFSFRPDREGTYIVEINNYQGIASINQPIYVGSGVPLLPNTLDYQGFPSPGAPLNARGTRDRWIDLINKDRAAFGLEPVALDDRLTAAAQSHIDDMIGRNYFSHAGWDGSTPTLRAQRAGVRSDTMVGENIGQGMGIEDLQAQLMASAAHRSNLLNPNWKRVGLGVGRYASGLMVGAQELGATAGEYDLSPQYFAGVELDQQVPTGIDADDRVEISGRVTQPARSVLVFFQNKETGRYVTFQPSVSRNGRFSVKLKFSRRQVGPYLMGISLNGAASQAAAVVVKA
ncbi:MAG: hypothetical protein KY468_18175 [Armatimonadetes bacterium]|nr:hypothetical protein [Armatimonadota bacterium]